MNLDYMIGQNSIPGRLTSWARLRLSCHIQDGGLMAAMGVIPHCQYDEDSAVAAMLFIVDTF
jgi:hypothetical protein